MLHRAVWYQRVSVSGKKETVVHIFCSEQNVIRCHRIVVAMCLIFQQAVFLTFKAVRPPGRTTVGRTPLDEWSARRRDLYVTTHNTHNRQTSIPPAVFEPTISSGERSQTYALDRTASGTGIIIISIIIIIIIIIIITTTIIIFNNHNISYKHIFRSISNSCYTDCLSCVLHCHFYLSICAFCSLSDFLSRYYPTPLQFIVFFLIVSPLAYGILLCDTHNAWCCMICF